MTLAYAYFHGPLVYFAAIQIIPSFLLLRPHSASSILSFFDTIMICLTSSGTGLSHAEVAKECREGLAGGER